jgi:hypothetical protein
MPRSTQWSGCVGAVLLVLVPLFGLKFIIELFAPGLAIWENPCISETKQEIANLSGLDFEISYANCDAIAKWETMNVFVSKAGSGNKAEIFKYSPNNIDDLPQIAVDLNNRRISILIKWISSIYFQAHHWEDMTIDYHIGKMTYPKREVGVHAPPTKPRWGLT